MTGRLVVAARGMVPGAQTTTETLAAIQQAEVVFYGGEDCITGDFVRKLNPNAEALVVAESYDMASGKTRLKFYDNMVERILTSVREGKNVIAAFYGSATTAVYAAQASIHRSRFAHRIA